MRADNKKSFMKSNLLHEGFEIGLIFKGIDGLLEILGGLILIFLNPEKMNRLLIAITQHELSEDPHDIFMNLLLKTSSHFSVSAQMFGIFYLLSHGIIKIILVSLLFRKKLWSYPLTMVLLILFIIYQLYRYSYSHSLWLIFLSIFDIAMICLTWIEYHRIQHHIINPQIYEQTKS
jgi:uncharacterized membrane protein